MIFTYLADTRFSMHMAWSKMNNGICIKNIGAGVSNRSRKYDALK